MCAVGTARAPVRRGSCQAGVMRGARPANGCVGARCVGARANAHVGQGAGPKRERGLEICCRWHEGGRRSRAHA
eukprot:1860508-Prymnesium_polylepis.1